MTTAAALLVRLHSLFYRFVGDSPACAAGFLIGRAPDYLSVSAATHLSNYSGLWRVARAPYIIHTCVGGVGCLRRRTASSLRHVISHLLVACRRAKARLIESTPATVTAHLRRTRLIVSILLLLQLLLLADKRNHYCRQITRRLFYSSIRCCGLHLCISYSLIERVSWLSVVWLIQRSKHNERR